MPWFSERIPLIEEKDGALDRLINQLRQNRGSIGLHPNDFIGWSRGARFYPLLYMLSRVWKAKDWETGVDLTNHLLGSMSQLQLHHIFPKAFLYEKGYEKSEVNALANFTFLTQDTNLKISDKKPSEYLKKYASSNPDLLRSHWIPLDEKLWEAESYLDFLEERRRLLANAANDFLDGLLDGSVPERDVVKYELKKEGIAIPGGVESEEEELKLKQFNEWIVAKGLPEGEYMYELLDTSNNQPTAFLDLAWPNGMQEGYSEPVALLLNEGKETEQAANKAGFRFFTDVEDFKEYVQREILGYASESA